MIRKLILFSLSAVMLLSLATLAGCGAPTFIGTDNEPAESKSTAETSREPDPTEATGSAHWILDVVPLTGVDANVIVTSVVEITDSFYASADNKFICPWIFIKNTGIEILTVDLFAFTLMDTEGNEYDASVYTPGNYYKGVDVLPGGLIEGPVYFEVPEAAEAYSLKVKPDLAWDDANLIEISLQETAVEPDGTEFTAEPVDYFSNATLADLYTPCNYDGKLAVQVTDAYYTESTGTELPCESYEFFQVALTVENLTSKDLDVTLDYMYKLYSPEYNHMLEQIPLPFADNELWVITMPAGDKQDYVLTFEAKQDCTELYLVVQDFFEYYEPIFFPLS